MVLHRRSNQRSPALTYGTIWHKILELHYKGIDRETINKFILRTYQAEETVEDYRTVARALLEYDNYLDEYGTPEAEGRSGKGTTIGDGLNALVEIPVELNIPGVRHPYTGKIDRIYKRNGLNYIQDHKTTSVLSKTYFNQWTLSQQMKGYAILGQLLIGEPIAGVNINLHVCRKSDSEFLRDTITFSQDILDECAENLDVVMAMIEASGETALTRPWAEAYPANFNACSGKFSMCQYAGVCSLGRRVRQQALESDFPVHPWNPLNVEDE